MGDPYFNTSEDSVPGSGPGLRPRPIPPMASPLLSPAGTPPPPPPPGPPPPPPPPSQAFKIRKREDPNSHSTNNAKSETGKLSLSTGDLMSELNRKLADGGRLKRADLSSLQRPASASLVQDEKPAWFNMSLKKTNGILGNKGRSSSTTSTEEKEKRNLEDKVDLKEVIQKKLSDYTLLKPNMPPSPLKFALPTQSSVKKDASTIGVEKTVPQKPMIEAREETPLKRNVVKETSPLHPAESPAFSSLENRLVHWHVEREGVNVEYNWWVLWTLRVIGFVMMMYSAAECEALMRLNAVANGLMEEGF